MNDKLAKICEEYPLKSLEVVREFRALCARWCTEGKSKRAEEIYNWALEQKSIEYGLGSLWEKPVENRLNADNYSEQFNECLVNLSFNGMDSDSRKEKLAKIEDYFLRSYEASKYAFGVAKTYICKGIIPEGFKPKKSKDLYE